MDFYIYTKGGHSPQPMDPLVLYMFFVECRGVFLGVSFYESQDIDCQITNRVWWLPPMSTHRCGVFSEPWGGGGGGQCGMFSVANISKIFTHSLPKGYVWFLSHIVGHISACENIQKVVAFTVNFYSSAILGRWGIVVASAVCPSICPSVCPSNFS